MYLKPHSYLRAHLQSGNEIGTGTARRLNVCGSKPCGSIFSNKSLINQISIKEGAYIDQTPKNGRSKFDAGGTSQSSWRGLDGNINMRFKKTPSNN